MHILSDIDDVVLDWTSGAEQFCQATFGTKTFPAELDVSLLAMFNQSDEFSRLEVFPDAADVLRQLKRAFDATIIGITACGTSEEVVSARLRNLHAVLPGVFSNIIAVPVGASKYSSLKRFTSDASVWVDDNPVHCVAGASLGIDTVHMDKYSRHQTPSRPNIIRCVNWFELLEKFSCVVPSSS